MFTPRAPAPVAGRPRSARQRRPGIVQAAALRWLRAGLGLALLWPLPGLGAADPVRRVDEAGLPLMQVFHHPEVRGASRQNWAVVQDDLGVIHVGNGAGMVLSFDGVRWRSTRLPGEAIVRSLGVDSAGRVHVGAIGDFGYLEADADGVLEFVSLHDRLPQDAPEFADVWATLPVDGAVYYFSFAGLFRHDGQSIDVFRPERSFHLAFEVGGRILVREVGRGLLELVDDVLQPLSGGELFAEERVYAVLPRSSDPGDRGLLIGTRDKGWWLHDGERLQRWPTEVDALMSSELFYGALRLEDGRLALATVLGGLLLIDAEGRLLRRIGRDQGLPDNAVFRMHEDREGGLWLALGQGVARLGTGAPLSRYDAALGLQGQVLGVRRHAGSLFATTTEGLFRLQRGADGTGRFEPVNAIRGQTWGLLSLPDELLVAALDGVWSLRDGQARRIRTSRQAAFQLLASRSDPQRVWVGLMDGLAAIRRSAPGVWEDEGVHPTLRDEFRTLHETTDGELWLGSWHRGAVRLRLRPGPAAGDPWSRMQAPERFPILDAGEGSTAVYLAEIDGEPRFGSRRGVLQFDPAGAGLRPDARFAGLFDGEERRTYPLLQGSDGALWMHAVSVAEGRYETGAARKVDGRWRWQEGVTALLEGLNVISLWMEADGVLWVGADDGLYRVQTEAGGEGASNYPTLVRGIIGRQSGRLVHGGSGPVPPLSLDYAENSLRFEFAATSHAQVAANRYRVMLSGLDQDWSPWSAETYRDYTNLMEGRYRFRVQARNAQGVIGDEATVALRILPPWYRSPLAYLGYLLVAVLLGYALLSWRSAAMRRRNLQLAQRVRERTSELSEANRRLAELSQTDALTGLRNRRYLAEHAAVDIALIDRHYRAPGSASSVLLFLMIDIDHFKQVNDRHGHAAGDRVLQQTSDILRQTVRDSDTVVRWGGEEFLVLARFTDPAFATELASRLRENLKAHRFDIGNGRSLQLTCSIGYAQYPLFPAAPQRVDWETVVNVADTCLYAAKLSWRDAWVGLRPGSQPPPDTPLVEPARHLPELVIAGQLEVVHSRESEGGVLRWS